MRGWLFVAFLATGCVHSDAVTCENGETCPAGTACDVAHSACVRPSQLETCSGLADGDPCPIDGLPGVCDKDVCIPAGCGDGYRQDPELCDGNDRGSGNCTNFGFYDSKTPLCNSACSYDTSNCTGFCGDGKVTEGFEICENTIPPIDTCVDYGYGAGVLGCAACGPGFATCKSFDWEIAQLVSPPVDAHGLADNDVYATMSYAGLAHWDGTAWSVVDLTSCLTGNDELEAVWEVSPGVVFATGSAGLVVRLENGSCQKWNTTGNDNHVDVWASSATNAWVVGYGGIFHFDGTNWTNASSTASRSIWGSGASDIYAVTNSDTLIHYNGTTWSAPQTISNMTAINKVWGTSATDIYLAGLGPSHGVVDHSTNGTAWAPILENEPLLIDGTASSVTSGSTANGRTVVSATRFGSGTVTFLLEYDGKGWANLEAPVFSTSFVWMSDKGRVLAANGVTNGIVSLAGSVSIDHQSKFPGFGAQIAVRAQNDVWMTSGESLHHWDGNVWTTPATDTLTDVSVAPNGTVFALAPDHLHVQGAFEDTSVAGSKLVALAANDVWILRDSLQKVQRWTAQNTSTDLPYTAGSNMRDVWGVAPAKVFLVGEMGVTKRWTGSAWAAMTSGTTADLVAVHGNSAMDVFAVGSQAGAAVVLHYDGNVNDTWTTLPAPPASWPRSVWGTMQDLFVGANEGLFHFDGTQWAPVDAGAPFYIDGLGGGGDTVIWTDYAGQPHQLVRTAPW